MLMQRTGRLHSARSRQLCGAESAAGSCSDAVHGYLACRRLTLQHTATVESLAVLMGCPACQAFSQQQAAVAVVECSVWVAAMQTSVRTRRQRLSKGGPQAAGPGAASSSCAVGCLGAPSPASWPAASSCIRARLPPALQRRPRLCLWLRWVAAFGCQGCMASCAGRSFSMHTCTCTPPLLWSSLPASACSLVDKSACLPAAHVPAQQVPIYCPAFVSDLTASHPLLPSPLPPCMFYRHAGPRFKDRSQLAKHFYVQLEGKHAAGRQQLKAWCGLVDQQVCVLPWGCHG